MLITKKCFCFFFQSQPTIKKRFINPLLSSIKKIIFKTEIVLLNTQILELLKSIIAVFGTKEIETS